MSIILPLIVSTFIIGGLTIKGKIIKEDGVSTMIKTNASEIVKMTTVITSVDEQGVETPVLDLTATFDTNTLELTEQSVVLNKELYVANAAEIKAQYTNFRNALIARAQTLGYIMF